MFGLALSVPANIKSYGQGNRHGIGIFEGNSTFQADNVIGQGNVVIRALHGFFHHTKGVAVLSAESDFGGVHEDKFVGGTRTADGANGAVDATFSQFAFPITGIRHQRAIFGGAQAFCDRQNRHLGV